MGSTSGEFDSEEFRDSNREIPRFHLPSDVANLHHENFKVPNNILEDQLYISRSFFTKVHMCSDVDVK